MRIRFVLILFVAIIIIVIVTQNNIYCTFTCARHLAWVMSFYSHRQSYEVVSPVV